MERHFKSSKKKAKKSYLEFVEVDSRPGTHFKSSVLMYHFTSLKMFYIRKTKSIFSDLIKIDSN